MQIMVTARISDEMAEMLKTVVGDAFCSYECGVAEFGETYGNLRMNFGKSAVELSNLVRELPFYDGKEDISCFACKRADEPFEPYCEEPGETYAVNEKVVSVHLVCDEISINDGAYEIAFDMAVIIGTERHAYTFSRGWFFSETIRISVDREFDEIYPIERVIGDWSDEGENQVRVRRSVRKL